MSEFDILANLVSVILAVLLFYLAWRVYRIHKGGLVQSPYLWMTAAGIVMAFHSVGYLVSETLGGEAENVELLSWIAHAMALLLMAVGLWKLLSVWKEPQRSQT